MRAIAMFVGMVYSLSVFANPQGCFQAARSYLSPNTAIELCRGAKDNSPVDCYVSSYRSIGPSVASYICQSARDAVEPVNCFQQASINHGASVARILCRASEDATETISCYEELRSRGQHPSTAMNLCSN